MQPETNKSSLSLIALCICYNTTVSISHLAAIRSCNHVSIQTDFIRNDRIVTWLHDYNKTMPTLYLSPELSVTVKTFNSYFASFMLGEAAIHDLPRNSSIFQGVYNHRSSIKILHVLCILQTASFSDQVLILLTVILAQLKTEKLPAVFLLSRRKWVMCHSNFQPKSA